MRQIACFSVKGGCGKSTVSAGLCYALRDMRDKGYWGKVGYLEADISGTSGHRAFNVDPPRLELDTEREKIIPPLVNGIKMFPLASKFTESACIGWKSADRELKLSGGEKVIDRGRTGFITDILTKSVDWGELEYLILDLPPSTSDETFTFFQCLPELYGVILISQPSQISVVGLRKTIDFLKREERPILGLVENMAYFLTPAGQRFYPFVSSRVDLKKLAREEGIPFLVSIPQVDDMARLKPYFEELADKVIKAEGKVLKQEVLSKRAKFRRTIIKKALGL